MRDQTRQCEDVKGGVVRDRSNVARIRALIPVSLASSVHTHTHTHTHIHTHTRAHCHAYANAGEQGCHAAAAEWPGAHRLVRAVELGHP
eukprot:1158226-Pelagomonas_calceolata.AAC.6